MAQQTDHIETFMSSPRIFLVRMLLFLVLVGLFCVILYKQIWNAFTANPGLNALIVFVLLMGIAFAFRQVIRLFPEVAWVNGFRLADPGLAVDRPPVLLAPVRGILRDRMGRMAMSPQTMRTIMDSIATRLDEARDISRYMTGVLVFLGLLGTFWGLIETVTSVRSVIEGLKVGGDAGQMFDALKEGLGAPLGGMGISFSSSLFGLAGSLILGFLDLQAGQAQNRFYTDLEDWLATTVRDLGVDSGPGTGVPPALIGDLRLAIERLREALADGGGGKQANNKIGNLAESVQSLIHHMRAEQQMVRDWASAQVELNRDIRKLMDALLRETHKT